MRDRLRFMLTALVVALALGVASCGDDEEEPAGGGGDQHGGGRRREEFPADTTMGKIQAKGEIDDRREVRRAAVRLQEPDERRHRGLRRRPRQGVRDEARGRAEVRRGDLGQPDPVHPGRHGRPDPVDDDDQRGARRRRSGSRTRTSSPRAGSWCRRTPTSRGIDDLAGKKVCTALGSTYEETLKTEAPKADLRLVDAYSECLELLQNGAVDAISTDDVILTGMIIQDDIAQARRRRADRRAVRRRVQEGRHGVRRVPQRRRSRSTSPAAAGRSPTTSGSGSTPASSSRRPTRRSKRSSRRAERA